MNAMLLMMGGSGTRFGARRPKQYTLIDSRPLFSYIVQKTEQADCIDRLVVVSHADWLDYVEEWCARSLYDLPYDVVAGGENRSESVRNGLTRLSEYARREDIVLIHDATHPYLDPEGIRAVIEAVEECGGATLVSKNYDTVYRANGQGFLDRIEPRELIVAGASPEAFRFGDIYDIYRSASPEELASMTSAGAIALEHDIPMKVVPSSVLNLKITYPGDMALFQALKDNYFFSDLEADRLYRDRLETLHVLDRLCKDEGIEYFAIANLLIGCVHYQRSIPGELKENWYVAMMREDYDRFLQALIEKGIQYGLADNRGSLGRTESSLWVQLHKSNPNGPVKERVFGRIYISPFDVLPSDPDELHYLKRRARKKNARLKKRLALHTNTGPDGGWAKVIHKIKRIIFSQKSNLRFFNRFHASIKRYRTRKHSGMVGRLIGSQSKILTLDELFPLEHLPFGDMLLPCPRVRSAWTEVMSDDLEKQIHTIQQVDLLIMKEFDRVCRKIGVGYFLCGGTMLGYVRHNGFIPWDDDVDCGMLRADYDRFLREAPKYLDTDRFFLQTRETDKMIPYLFSKLRMNHTEYITTYNDGRHFHKGICLDIFPFDVLPEDPQEQALFLQEVRAKVKKHNRVCNRQHAETVNEYPPENLSEAWHRVLLKCVRRFYKKLPLARTQRQYLDVATRYNDQPMTPDTVVASFVPTYTYIKLSDLLPYQDIQFEGVPSMLMHNPDVFLHMQYGDYMAYPPVHQQVGHDLIRWSADIPELETPEAEQEK